MNSLEAQMKPLEQVYELIARSGEAGIRVGDIQTAEDPTINKKAWAHRNRAWRLVVFLESHGYVVEKGRRATLVQGVPRPDFTKFFGSGHETELYPVILGSQILDQILRQGREADTSDDVPDSQFALSGSISSAKGRSTRLGLPDFIGFVNRSIEGIPYLEAHSFEVKNSGGAHREAVFQALGQRALGIYTHSWIIAVIGTKPEDREQAKLLVRECQESGIGLITIEESQLADEISADLRPNLWPTRVAIEPRRQYEHFSQLGVLQLLHSVVSGRADDDVEPEI